ncbi:MAG: GDSL-type esterase/lipase family protein [Candidatus Omnitrophota bacterium]|jgi:lysophospholipase L1-like esterase
MKRNRAFLPVLVFTFAMVFFCGCVDIQVTNVDSGGTNIICFGDSLTIGYGVEVKYSYPSVMGKLVPPGVPVINAGIEGDRTQEALKRFKTDVLEKEPFLVIIEFGANDFFTRVPLTDTLKNLEEMIKTLQARRVIVALVDMGTPFVMEEYSKPYRALAKQYGAIFIPQVLEGIITEPSLKSDFMHPNSAGYKIIGHRIYRAILPYLSRNLILKRFKASLLKK